MQVEWDAAKNRRNIAKHGIDFEDAIEIFAGPVTERPDDRRMVGEQRWIAYGLMQLVVIVVVYVDRGERRRIVSARRATKDEAEHYYQTVFG
jgi:hypothetical protein